MEVSKTSFSNPPIKLHMCTERVLTKNKMIFVHHKKKNKETQKFYKKQIDQSVRNSHME